VPYTSFLNKEHVSTATVLAIEGKMSIPNLSFRPELQLLEKVSSPQFRRSSVQLRQLCI